MMNDERDRRDEPVDGSTGEDSSTRSWPAEPGSDRAPSTDPTEPTAAGAGQLDAPEASPAQDEFETAPATGGGWPQTDAPRDPWPTEPPAAGSGDADTWPTRAPERGDEPAWVQTPEEPTAPTADADLGERTYDEPLTEHPPSEAEAYAPPAPAPDDARLDDTAAMAAAGAPAPAHAVPAAGEVGESTQCPRCGTENRPGLAFCRNCGQRLVAAGVSATVERPGTPEGTMACPRCGTHNRAGVAFCQNCGANLRTAAAPGYVPPAAGPATDEVSAAAVIVEERALAVLGPIVLLIGAAGIVAGWLLPFQYGSGGSLFDRAFGAGGYGASFWSGYPDVPAGLADQAYFGFAAPAPILAALLVILAIAGMACARPGALQSIGLVVALLWSIGLAVLFVVVEVLGNAGGPVTDLLRQLNPGGIIFFLAALIVLIGTLTRFARS